MAQVSINGLEDKQAFIEAGVKLPLYNIEDVRKKSHDEPVWLHFGAGNIFRGYIASLQQDLLNKGLANAGIQTISSMDCEVVDRACIPYDNLTTYVTLLPDASVELEIIGSISKCLKLNGSCREDELELERLIACRSLQMISYTITEKGYALKDIDGNFTKLVQENIDAGPDGLCRHSMTLTTRLLYIRYKNGAHPLALVSMDNCSHNGDKVKEAVLTVAKAWLEKGFVDEGFIDYIQSEKISFPWSMIDKITPRPDPSIASLLKERGIENMEPIKTSFGSFIAPFVNAEKPQYLIIEDNFPNGRPPLEKAGVLFTDKNGVDLCERMKVTTCLNPLHTALAVYGCLLGYKLISAEMEDKELVALVKKLGYDEGLKVVDDPVILNPRDFLTEVVEQRLTNKCLPDTPQRIATDTSQKVTIRFGETLKNYKKKGLDATTLIALPLSIAGWLRYLLAIDDKGQSFELSDDPLKDDLKAKMASIVFGQPESVKDSLKPILSNETLFGVDLYSIGLGTVIENMFGMMLKGPGAVRATLEHYLK